MATPMEHDDVPSGTSPSLPATRSVTDLLWAHRATSEWKIVSSTHLLAQCHYTGCPLCADYIVHLAWGGNAGELSSRPPGLGNALDKAWLEEMVCICEAAWEPLQAELPKAHQIIDRQHDDLTAAKSDYNRLGDKLDEEVAYWRHIEDKVTCAEEEITCNKGRLCELGETTIPNLRLVQHRAMVVVREH